MYNDTASGVKRPCHATLGIQRWWDHGSVPIWITAQRQVKQLPHPRGQQAGQVEGDLAEKGRDPGSPSADSFPTSGVPGFVTQRGITWGPKGGGAGRP